MKAAFPAPIKPPVKSDIRAAWDRFEKRLDKMTREEKLQTFVNAGILTKKGKLTKPYREMEDSTKP